MHIESTPQNYPNKVGMVYKLLQENILRRNLLPGERLIERELVEKFGVSSTIIREALARLAKDELISILPYRGAFVTKLSEKDIIEIYELREAIEGLAGRWAAERASEEKIQQLKSLIKILERRINENGWSYRDAAMELKFHDLTAEMSGNTRLHKIINDLRSQCKLLISTSIARPERAKEAFEEEKKVLEAII